MTAENLRFSAGAGSFAVSGANLASRPAKPASGLLAALAFETLRSRPLRARAFGPGRSGHVSVSEKWHIVTREMRGYALRSRSSER